MAQRIMSEAAGQVLADEIKSNTSGLASLAENYAVYSTSERKCGTWIDGRTVYRKTLVFALNNVIDDQQGLMSSTNYQHGIVGISNVVGLEGALKTSDGNTWYPVSHAHPYTNSISSIFANKTSIGVRVAKESLAVGGTAYITILYTKTT